MYNKLTLRLIMLSFALMLLLAGCAENDTTTETPIDTTPVTVTKPAENKVDAESKESAKKDLQISSQHEGNTTDGKEETDKEKEPAKLPNYNVAEPFDTTRPTLMGFAIGDSADAVAARFGLPQSESTMNDGGKLQVLEYPGFSIGINENKSIIFIEVTSDQIAPGLNQFRVGQTVDQAQKALGPADSLNEYVMIYEFEDLILKCDLDPNSRTVIAIKLFAA